MICLRCGYCCKHLMVMIVDNPEKGLQEGNIIFHNGISIPCKHLHQLKSGRYSCKVHNRKWYKQTPCFAHSQIEQKNSNCRIGEFILRRLEKSEVKNG